MTPKQFRAAVTRDIKAMIDYYQAEYEREQQLTSAVPPLPDEPERVDPPVTGADACPYCKGTGVREPVSYAPGRPWLNVSVGCYWCKQTGRIRT